MVLAAYNLLQYKAGEGGRQGGCGGPHPSGTQAVFSSLPAFHCLGDLMATMWPSELLPSDPPNAGRRIKQAPKVYTPAAPDTVRELPLNPYLHPLGHPSLQEPLRNISYHYPSAHPFKPHITEKAWLDKETRKATKQTAVPSRADSGC